MAPVSLQTFQKQKRHGNKRKRALTDGGDEVSPKPETSVPESSKKRSRANEEIDESIGHMDPSLLADHVAKKTKRSFGDLSNVELEDKYLSQQIFYDTSNFDLLRNLDNLPTFLEHFSNSNESFSNTSENTGSPHTLVVAASGLRAADVTRFRIWSSDAKAMLRL